MIRYENDDVTKPITSDTKEQSYQVSSDYTTKVIYKINGKDKSYEVDEITMTPDELYEVLGDYGWVDTINYAAEYSNGERPRYAQRKMDSEGKAWSISVNP